MKLSETIEEFVSLRIFRGSPLTTARYDRLLRIFCICMHDPDLEQLDIRHVVWYLGELRRLKWKPNGINLIAIALRKFFEFCNLRGYKTFNEQLIPIPKKEFNMPRVTTIEKFKKVLREVPHGSDRPHHLRNRALLLLLWDSGARVGEAVSLNVDDLDLKKRTAIIRTEKSRGRRPVRQIFWTEATNRALKKWVKKKEELQRIDAFRDCEALFISISKCGRYDVRGKRMTNRGVAGVLQMLSNRAELPTVNAHSIRHSMGRDTKKSLKDISAVADILGHSNIESSYVYSMLFGDEYRDEWEAVMRYRGSPVPAPKLPGSFPLLKTSRASISGGIRGVKIRTSKYGRMVRR